MNFKGIAFPTILCGKISFVTKKKDPAVAVGSFVKLF